MQIPRPSPRPRKPGYTVDVRLTVAIRDETTGRTVTELTTTGHAEHRDPSRGAATAIAPALTDALADQSRMVEAYDRSVPDA